MDRPGSNHRDPWFPPFFAQVLEDVKFIFNTTEGSSIIYPGTGTGGWEASLQNTLSPGDKIVTFRYGQFSHLWIDQMQVGATCSPSARMPRQTRMRLAALPACWHLWKGCTDALA